MANELVLLTELESPVGFTCADGAGIEKGTLLELADPMTVAKVTGAAPLIIGVAAEEKIASDGKTEIGVYLRGIFKATAGGSITVGDGLIGENATNELLTSTAAADEVEVCGIALETASDGETFKMLLNVGIGGSPET
tara:strand:+ start:1677 stop:2090 length:414 start_codon:yes stop_codon:yes gene_type:complete